MASSKIIGPVSKLIVVFEVGCVSGSSFSEQAAKAVIVRRMIGNSFFISSDFAANIVNYETKRKGLVPETGLKNAKKNQTSVNQLF